MPTRVEAEIPLPSGLQRLAQCQEGATAQALEAIDNLDLEKLPAIADTDGTECPTVPSATQHRGRQPADADNTHAREAPNPGDIIS